MNIILIGMPASGKSTVGVILAKLLGFDFIDTDLLIQRQTALHLSEIIQSQGLDAFLAVEEVACLSLYANHSVIATGGSVIYSANAMHHLKELGTIIYLSVDFKTLQSRLHDVRGRGVVLRPGQSLMDLYAERMPLYRQYADITVFPGSDSKIRYYVRKKHRLTRRSSAGLLPRNTGFRSHTPYNRPRSLSSDKG